MMTWAQIKQMLTYEFGPYVGRGFVNSDSGSPTELAYKVHLAHNIIMAHPYEWEFSKAVGTITLTGATTYNLKTLLPDLMSVYQLWGINQNQEQPYVPNYEANVIPQDGYSLRGNTLIFSGNIPTAGTANLQYKSSYMVLDASGNRKQFFTDDSDTTVLDDADINVIIFGAGRFIRRKTDEPVLKTRYGTTRGKDEQADFEQALTNMMLRNKQSRQNTTML